MSYKVSKIQTREIKRLKSFASNVEHIITLIRERIYERTRNDDKACAAPV